LQFEPPQRNLHRQSQTQASVFLVPERRVSLLLRLNVTVVDSQRHCCCFSTSLLLRHNVTVVVSQHQCTSVTRFLLVPERRVSLLLRLNVTVVVSQHQCQSHRLCQHQCQSQRHCCCFSTPVSVSSSVSTPVSVSTSLLLFLNTSVSLIVSVNTSDSLNVTVVVSQHQCHTRFSGPSEIKHQADRPSLTCNEYTRTHSPQLLLHAIPFTHRYFLFLQGIAL